MANYDKHTPEAREKMSRVVQARLAAARALPDALARIKELESENAVLAARLDAEVSKRKLAEAKFRKLK